MSPLPKFQKGSNPPDPITIVIDKVVGEFADEHYRPPENAEVTDIILRDYPDKVDDYLRRKRRNILHSRVAMRLSSLRSVMAHHARKGKAPEFWKEVRVWVPTDGDTKLITECRAEDHRAIADWYEATVVTLTKRIVLHRKLERVVGDKTTGEAVGEKWLQREIKRAYGDAGDDEQVKKAIALVR